MKRFPRTLASLRKEAGFHTSYAFYHRNGGRRTFPFTYAYYAKIERGCGLPRGEWLPLFLKLLKIESVSESREALLRDYLCDLFGDEEIFDSLVTPMFGKPLAGRERGGGEEE